MRCGRTRGVVKRVSMCWVSEQCHSNRVRMHLFELEFSVVSYARLQKQCN